MQRLLRNDLVETELIVVAGPGPVAPSSPNLLPISISRNQCFRSQSSAFSTPSVKIDRSIKSYRRPGSAAPHKLTRAWTVLIPALRRMRHFALDLSLEDSLARSVRGCSRARACREHIGETDCMAGVVRLELRNPLGSKSARIAGGILPIWAKRRSRDGSRRSCGVANVQPFCARLVA